MEHQLTIKLSQEEKITQYLEPDFEVESGAGMTGRVE